MIREKKKRKANQSPSRFAWYYFDHYLQQTSPPFHHDIYRLLEAGTPRLALAAPRGHAKSTMVSLFYVLWAVCTGRKRFVVLISDSGSQANLLLHNIKQELLGNPRLVEDYRLESGGRWTEDDVLLSNGARIMARGARMKLRGLREREQRPDLVVADDLEDDEHVRSADNRAFLKAWFAGAVENMVDPIRGQIIAVGTLLHPFSLMAELVNPAAWQGYVKKVYRAFDAEGRPIFPQRFSREKLESIRRDIGAFAFQCEYMNDPVDEETKVFHRAWLRYFDYKDHKGLDIVAAIDPALSQKSAADYFVCLTLGFDPQNEDYYILDIYRAKASLDCHVREVLARAAQFQWRVLGVEQVAFQQVLQPLLRRRAGERGLSLHVQGIEAAGDKHMRIQSLQPLFEEGKIRVRGDQQEFIEEYDLYPAVQHDDQLDALEMALRIQKKTGARVRAVREG